MLEDSELATIVASILGNGIRDLRRVRAGRNSRVYRAVDDNGLVYAVKHYEATSGWDRLSVESAALQFLRAHGVRQAPQALALDKDRGIGIYEYVDGVSPCALVTAADIDAAADFLLQLDQVAGATRDEWIEPAAEAFFSFDEVVANIEGRLQRLAAVGTDVPLARELQQFLHSRLRPLLTSVAAWGEERLARNGLSMRDALPVEARTLSPSDFGFHNAVRRPDSSIVFLDFEYFGWDDPAKMVSDFVLHPAMDLSEELKRRFVDRVCGALRGRAFLVKRLAVAYALYGIKWCAILLNEFDPEHLGRRVFAGDSRAREDVLSSQLAKAEEMRDHVERTYKDCPYGG